MPNTKSAIRRVRRVKKQTSVNKVRKSKYKSAVKHMESLIKKGGSSIRDFKNTSGEKGNFQKDFKVYGREGANCYRSKCEGTIKKKVISNRSTFFCPNCQK